MEFCDTDDCHSFETLLITRPLYHSDTIGTIRQPCTTTTVPGRHLIWEPCQHHRDCLSAAQFRASLGAKRPTLIWNGASSIVTRSDGLDWRSSCSQLCVALASSSALTRYYQREISQGWLLFLEAAVKRVRVSIVPWYVLLRCLVIFAFVFFCLYILVSYYFSSWFIVAGRHGSCKTVLVVESTCHSG